MKSTQKPGEYSFCIGYGYDYEEAVKFREMLKDLIKERLGIEEIEICQIGATIGVHTGPYPIGVGIIKKSRVGRENFIIRYHKIAVLKIFTIQGSYFFHIFRDIFYLYASNLCKKK